MPLHNGRMPVDGGVCGDLRNQLPSATGPGARDEMHCFNLASSEALLSTHMESSHDRSNRFIPPRLRLRSVGLAAVSAMNGTTLLFQGTDCRRPKSVELFDDRDDLPFRQFSYY